MNIDKARALIEQALRELAPVSDASAPAPLIATPEEFDRALAAVATGEWLTLATSFVYPGPVTLRKPVGIKSEQNDAGRMTADAPAPRFLRGMIIESPHVALKGLELRHTNPLTEILTITGRTCSIDRCRLLGDPIKGAKRAIAGNGPDGLLVRNYIDDCFQSYPGNDSQAILVWRNRGPLLIEDNYLRGGSETILIGGADPATDADIPSDLIIRGNTITANPDWQPKPIGVKTRFEIKNARRVLVTKNVIEHCWGGHGQDGYLLTLTVRNQDGRAPFSTIEDIEISENTFAHGAAAINLLGSDNNHPSQTMARVQILRNRFTDLDPKTYTGSTKMILIARGPRDVTIDQNVFQGVNIGSQIYFSGVGQQVKNLRFTNNAMPPSKYGLFGEGVAVNQAWAKYVVGGLLEGNKEIA